MRKNKWLVTVIALIAFLGAFSGCGADEYSSIADSDFLSSSSYTSETSEASEAQESTTEENSKNTFVQAEVVRHVDGDTFVVRVDNQDYKLRLIGVDTPETKHPRKPVQYFGREASNYTAEQAPIGKKVWLERDVTEFDKYGRLLRYVWLEQPSSDTPTESEIKHGMLNAILVIGGYAAPSPYPPDVKYEALFNKLSQEARNNGWGLWGAPAGSASNVPGQTGRAQQPANSYENTQAPAGATYIGNGNTGKFHYPSCYSVSRMNPANQVVFNSREEAINSGFVPCQNCNP